MIINQKFDVTVQCMIRYGKPNGKMNSIANNEGLQPMEICLPGNQYSGGWLWSGWVEETAEDLGGRHVHQSAVLYFNHGQREL